MSAMSAVRKQLCCFVSYGWRNTFAVLPWQPPKKSLCSAKQQVSSTQRQSYCITLSKGLGNLVCCVLQAERSNVDHEGSKLVNFIRCKSSGTSRCELGKEVPAFRRNVMSSSVSNSQSRDCLDFLTVFRTAALRMSYLPTTGYTGLFISPSGISELDCGTTKTDTAERSISIGRESLQVFFLY